MRQVISTDKVHQSGNPLSQAIKAGNFIFVSGQVGKDPVTGVIGEGIEEQTRLCLDNMNTILGAANASLANVVKVTIYVTDLKDVKAMNGVYGQYFSKEPPARLCVEVSNLAGGALIELDAVALVSKE